MAILQYSYLIGIDLGTTYIKAAYAHFDESQGKWSDPEPLHIGQHNVYTPSLVLYDSKQQEPLAVGWQALNKELITEAASIENPVDQIFRQRDLSHVSLITALLRPVNIAFQESINSDSIPDEQIATVVGYPVGWEPETSKRALIEAVEMAGFSNVTLLPSAIAALQYNIVKNKIRLENRIQRWLVVDLGGRSSSIASVEWNGPQHGLHLADHVTIDWCNDKIDDLLLEKFILPQYIPNQPLTTDQDSYILKQDLRILVEKFSMQCSLGHDRTQHTIRLYGRPQVVELSKGTFEADTLAGSIIDQLKPALQPEKMIADRDFLNYEQVIFSGGGAEWYFVQQPAGEIWGRDRCVFPDPGNALTITAQGLSLSFVDLNNHLVVDLTGPARMSSTEYDEQETKKELIQDGLQELQPIPVQPLPDRQSLRKDALKRVWIFTIVGASFALLLFWLPGASSLILTFLEALMLINIARIYKYNLESGALLLTGFLLVLVSLLAKVLVLETLILLPGLGWLIKPVVAAIIIYGLGEIAIHLLETGQLKDVTRNMKR